MFLLRNLKVLILLCFITFQMVACSKSDSVSGGRGDSSGAGLEDSDAPTFSAQEFLNNELLKAVKADSWTNTKLYLDAGANPNARIGSSDVTIFNYAAQKCKNEIIELLLKNGGDPDLSFGAIQAVGGSFALAAMNKANPERLSNLQILLDYQSNKNPYNQQEPWVISFTINQDFEALSILLIYANPNLKSKDGKTALDYVGNANSGIYLDIKNLLLSKGAKHAIDI